LTFNDVDIKQKGENLNKIQTMAVLSLGCVVTILISGYLVSISSMTSVCNFLSTKGELRSSTTLVSGWRRDWNYDTDNDNCRGIAATNDKVYIAGNVQNGATHGSIFLARYDYLGQKEINNTWLMTGAYACSVNALALSNNATFVGGYVAPTSGVQETLLVVKLDLNGQELWNFTKDYSSHDQAIVYAMVTSGNDVYACGTISVTATGDVDAFVMKLHGNNGTLAWDATWFGGGVQAFVDIAISGNIVSVAGDDGGNTMQIKRYYTNGTYIDTFTWNSGKFSAFSCVGLATLNGNYYLGGAALNATRDVLLVKLNSSGAEIWNKTWGGSKTETTFCIEANGSSVFVGGRSNSYTTFGAGFWLQFNENGTLMANRTIGGDSETTTITIAVCGSSIYVGGYFWRAIGPPYDHVFLTRFVINTAPVVSHPADIQFTQGTSGHAITWNINDLSSNMTSYSVTRNGTGIKNGTWNSGDSITVNVDGLAVGSYGFEIVVQDGLGEQVTDQVLLAVVPQDNSTVVLVIILCVVGGLVVVAVFEIRSLEKQGIIHFKKKRE
jgi:hypothetical protein